MSASEQLASDLRAVLAETEPVSPQSDAPRAASKVVEDQDLGFLREVTVRLQDASSRGEILPVVLEYAAELFERVAILTVRDGEVFAVAGSGIAALEVDPLDSPGPVSIETTGVGWLRRILDHGEPFEAAPETPADEALLERFGGVKPGSIYLGPIESGNSVIALLYGDQGESERAMPPTSGLEVVLHQAGLALDRAALERALWEADAGSRSFREHEPGS